MVCQHQQQRRRRLFSVLVYQLNTTHDALLANLDSNRRHTSNLV
jgi:hypothetical protein